MITFYFYLTDRHSGVSVTGPFRGILTDEITFHPVFTIENTLLFLTVPLRTVLGHEFIRKSSE